MQDNRDISAIVNSKISDLVHDFMNFNALKIASEMPVPHSPGKYF